MKEIKEDEREDNDEREGNNEDREKEREETTGDESGYTSWLEIRFVKYLLIIIVCLMAGCVLWAGIVLWGILKPINSDRTNASQQETVTQEGTDQKDPEAPTERIDSSIKADPNPQIEPVSSATKPVIYRDPVSNKWHFNNYYLPYSDQPVYVACKENAWYPDKNNKKFQLNPELEIPQRLSSQRFNVVQFESDGQIVWAIWPDDGGCYIHHNDPRQNEGEGLSLLISQCQ